MKQPKTSRKVKTNRRRRGAGAEEQRAGRRVPSSRESAVGPERTVKGRLGYVDSVWLDRQIRIVSQVCRVERSDAPLGTGFLVGADVLLTAHHVVQDVIAKKWPVHELGFRFDYRILESGERSNGMVVRLAHDWLIDASPCTAGEQRGQPDASIPRRNQLDFALLRLAEPVGSVRGWVPVPTSPPPLYAGMPIHIVQHPQGQPLKIALDTEAVIAITAGGCRVRYATNTEPGSSGSPCFDLDGTLVALHHYGDPAYGHPPAYNQGIPIYLIRERLRRQGKERALGGPPPIVRHALIGGEPGRDRDLQRRVLVGVPELPPHHHPRPELVEQLESLLIARAGTKSPKVVGIRGQGAVGKTVLAQEIAHRETIQRAFPDGVFWLTLGRNANPAILQAELLFVADRQYGIAARVIDEPRNSGTGNEVRRSLEEHFAKRRVLLVLDDVWSSPVVSALKVLGDEGRYLVTTRDGEVLTALGAHPYPLGAMANGPTMSLLASWSGIPAEDLPGTAMELAAECGYLPLALAVAGALVRDGTSWGSVLSATRAGKVRYLQHADRNVFSSLWASVDALGDVERDRFLELAVLPDGMPMPTDTIARYWSRTGGLTEYESDHLLALFATRSLLKRDKDGSVSVHDLNHDFIQTSVDDPGGLHERFLDAAGLAAMAVPTVLADRLTELADSYIWRQVGFHLHAAGRHRQLRACLLSFSFLRARLKAIANGSAAIIAEYGASPSDGTLRTLAETLQLSAGAVERDLRNLPSQLVGRLESITNPEIAALCEEIDREVGGPWLRPVWASLQRPGGPLILAMGDYSGINGGLAFLPGGTSAVSAADRVVRIWEPTTRTTYREFHSAEADFSAMAISRDGGRLICASKDRLLTVWDTATGVHVHSLPLPKEISQISVSGDGQRIVAPIDSDLWVWDADSGEEIGPLRGHENSITEIAALGKDRLVSASFDGTVRIWDLTNHRQLAVLSGHDTWVNVLAVSRDAEVAVSGDFYGMVKIWDLSARVATHSFQGSPTRTTAVAVSPDGNRVVAGFYGGTLFFADLLNGQEDTRQAHSGWVGALEFLPDGRHAISGSADRLLKVWDLVSGVELASLKGAAEGIKPDGVRLSGDGRLALSVDFSDTVSVWRLPDFERGDVSPAPPGQSRRNPSATPTGRQRLGGAAAFHTPTARELFDGAVMHADPDVVMVCADPSRNRAVTAHKDRSICLWNLQSGATVHRYRTRSAVVSLAISDASGLALVATDGDGSIEIFDLKTGEPRTAIPAHDSGIGSLTMTHGGTRAISTSWSELKVWDVSARREVLSVTDFSGPVSSVAVAPNGRRLATGYGDGSIEVWDLRTGKLVWWTKAFAKPDQLAFSLDGRKLVCTQAWQTELIVWDAYTGRKLRELVGHTWYVLDLVAVAGQNRLLSCSGDRTLIVWDLRSGTSLHALSGHEGGVTSCAVTRDGQRAISIGGDRTARLWNLASGTAESIMTFDANPTALALVNGEKSVLVGDATGALHRIELCLPG